MSKLIIDHHSCDGEQALLLMLELVIMLASNLGNRDDLKSILDKYKVTYRIE